MIIPYQPVRLFVDIEKKNPVGDEEALLQRVISDIREAYQALDETKAAAPDSVLTPIIMDSSKPNVKFSVHVVWDAIWFKDTGHLKRFIVPIASKYPKDFVDVGVYSEHAIKQLRLPYTERPDRDPERIFRIRGGPTVIRDPMDWFQFKRCCVSCTITNPPKDPTMLAQCGSPSSSSSSSSSAKRHRVGMDPHMERILDYLSVIHGNLRPSGITRDANGEWSMQITPAMFCPCRTEAKGDGFHAGNSTIIGSCKGRIYHMCMDEACRKRYYFAEDMEKLTHL